MLRIQSPHVKAKHQKTLDVLFKKPTSGSIKFTDIESLVIAVGGEVREGAGSRVVFERNGSRLYLHRPHPDKEARKYQVEELRDWLAEQGLKP